MVKQSNTPPKRATIFAITSGKGGVGKTSLSVNAACEFSRRGYRTMIIDAGGGLAHTSILANIKPAKTLSAYINGQAELADIITDGPDQVKIIRGGDDLNEQVNLDSDSRARICNAIQDLAQFCDVIMIDTRAGVSKCVTDFVTLADQAVIVTTSNFAAIADSYGSVKAITQHGFKKTIHTVTNRVRSPEEARRVFLKLNGCAERFLGFQLNWLGLLPEDRPVEGVVSKRSPFNEVFLSSVASRHIGKLVSGLERYVETRKPVWQAANDY